MSKTIKSLLIILNVVMILLSIKWYLTKYEDEPLISIIGQLSALIVIMSENKINSFISAKKNIRSNVDVDAAKGDTVKVNKNEDSEIKIKTRD